MGLWSDMARRGTSGEVRKEDDTMTFNTIYKGKIVKYNNHIIDPDLAKDLKSCDIEVRFDGSFHKRFGSYYERFHLVCKEDEDEQEVLKSIMFDVEQNPVSTWEPDEHYNLHQVELPIQKGIKHRLLEHNGAITGVDPWL